MPMKILHHMFLLRSCCEVFDVASIYWWFIRWTYSIYNRCWFQSKARWNGRKTSKVNNLGYCRTGTISHVNQFLLSWRARCRFGLRRNEDGLLRTFGTMVERSSTLQVSCVYYIACYNLRLGVFMINVFFKFIRFEK